MCVSCITQRLNILYIVIGVCGFTHTRGFTRPDNLLRITVTIYNIYYNLYVTGDTHLYIEECKSVQFRHIQYRPLHIKNNSINIRGYELIARLMRLTITMVGRLNDFLQSFIKSAALSLVV